MKKIFLLLLSAILFTAILPGCTPEQPVPNPNPEQKSVSVRVMTHNIRFAYKEDDDKDGSNYGGRPAKERMADELAFLKEQNCDIVFLNEVAKYQDEVLQREAESLGYGYVRESDFKDGIHTYNGVKENYYNARFCNYILYKKDTFTLKETKSFSLSDNPSDPHAPFSKMSDDALWSKEGRPRTAVWALLEHTATGATLFTTCAHAQWVTNDGANNWNAQGLLVLSQQIGMLQNQFPGSHAVFGGDFNSEKITAFSAKKYTTANLNGAIKTFGDTALDHIYFSSEGTCSDVTSAGNLNLSDHLALQAKIEFPL